MSALTATSWTVTRLSFEIVKKNNTPRPIKHGMFKLVLASGGEVATAGVPIPKAAMGFVKKANYILQNDIDSAFSTASARALHWNVNASGESVQAYRLTTMTGALANTGGRAIRKLATSISIDTPHTLYMHAYGW